MSSSREQARLQDILDNVVAIEGYTEKMRFEDFSADRRTVDACERCLQRITEAATKIGEDRMRVIAPDAPFHAIRGFGNSLRHEYDRIDDRIVFDTIVDELPRLKRHCEAALAENTSQ